MKCLFVSLLVLINLLILCFCICRWVRTHWEELSAHEKWSKTWKQFEKLKRLDKLFFNNFESVWGIGVGKNLKYFRRTGKTRKTHDLGRIHMNFKAQRKTQDLKLIQKTGKNLRLRKVLWDLERISKSQYPKYFKTLPKSYKFCPSLINSSQVSYETWEGFIKLGKNLKYFERIWNTLKEFEILGKNLRYLRRI